MLNMAWGGGDEDAVNGIQLLQHFPFNQTFWNFWKTGKCTEIDSKFLENPKIVQFQNVTMQQEILEIQEWK